jgi:hypothetical protein
MFSTPATTIFVTPIAEFAFDGCCPIVRDVADYRRHRGETRVADVA